MKFCWSLILCISGIHVASAIFPFLKERENSEHKPGGILGILTKPKLPAIQIGTHFGPGSFGFGFGIGGHFGSSTGGYLPPKEKEHVKPQVPWEEEKKEIMRPRPNWEEGDRKDPKPESYEDNEDPNPGSYKDKKDLPDWEEIGEDQDEKSDDLTDGDLVGDGVIQPRQTRNRYRNRGKRFIDSKVYHVNLRFLSNAKPYQVKIHSHPNSLNDEN